MKNKSEFDVAYNDFLYEKDVQKHHHSIRTLLSEINLENEFSLLIDEENGVRNFFLLWEKAGLLEQDQTERQGLKALGVRSKILYKKKNYKELCELFEVTVLRHIVEHINLESRSDYEDITDQDLFTQKLIPEEIYFHYFILGTLAKANDFDWNRGEKIAEQNLACMIACFEDIYGFLNCE